MKPEGSGPTTTPESRSAELALDPPPSWTCPPDVRLCGHLRKQKSQRRRFFVLRADPPRLECYETEKLFHAGRRPPKLSVSLAGACTISKRVDARRRHLIVLYTRDRSLGVAAASEAEQQAWYCALLEARAAAGPSSHEDPEARILAPFQDVWPVTLRPKGLGRTRALGSGSYRLCLGSGVLSLMRKPAGRGSEATKASPPLALCLSLLSVRRCGHADSFFFLELGRSAPTGSGELWLQAPDAMVAQSIHETVLAAMKRIGDSGLAGEYVCIEHLGMRTAIPDLPDGSLNYVDLDLVPPLEARGDAPKTRQHLHSYARIEFQNLREAQSSCNITPESQVILGPQPCL
ncbi:Insulin receptor substrate 1 [Camelus dromedarius]|uniref:Insulin receptor substrate 1 n=1 Tax=Camelus dromedarius TaxID=9838 RepID=A0A5N4CW63_CAMDR|nr:Insulin receptor substrate 1 [Camelus dromedarius]